jgi:naphthoate synthase
MEVSMAYEEILYEEDGPIGTITLNRPDDGNMFTERMCHEIRDCINDIRRETRTRVIVLTGAGEKFFCTGGRKDGMQDSKLYAGVLPVLEMYENIDRLQKPVKISWARSARRKSGIATRRSRRVKRSKWVSSTRWCRMAS